MNQHTSRWFAHNTNSSVHQELLVQYLIKQDWYQCFLYAYMYGKAQHPSFDDRVSTTYLPIYMALWKQIIWSWVNTSSYVEGFCFCHHWLGWNSILKTNCFLARFSRLRTALLPHSVTVHAVVLALQEYKPVLVLVSCADEDRNHNAVSPATVCPSTTTKVFVVAFTWSIGLIIILRS